MRGEIIPACMWLHEGAWKLWLGEMKSLMPDAARQKLSGLRNEARAARKSLYR